MNIYINAKTDADLVKKIKEEARKDNRSESFIIRKRLRQAYEGKVNQ